jgi:hypothetical protein
MAKTKKKRSSPFKIVDKPEEPPTEAITLNKQESSERVILPPINTG